MRHFGDNNWTVSSKRKIFGQCLQNDMDVSIFRKAETSCRVMYYARLSSLLAMEFIYSFYPETEPRNISSIYSY